MVSGSARLLTTETGSDSGGLQVKYAATYQIDVTDVTDGWSVVSRAPGLPGLGQGYPADGRAYLVSYSFQREKDTQLMWLVTANYESPPIPKDSSGGAAKGDNPLAWRDEVSWHGAKFTGPVTQSTVRAVLPKAKLQPGDLSLVVNSAGEAYSPPPERDFSRGILTVRRFLPYPDIASELQFRDKINQTSWTSAYLGLTFDPKTLKFEPMTMSLKYHITRTGAEILYWENIYNLAVRWDTWTVLRPSIGSFRSAGPGDPNGHGGTYSSADMFPGRPLLERIVDKNQKPVSNVALDINGQPVNAPGSGPQAITPWDDYDSADFSPLNF